MPSLVAASGIRCGARFEVADEATIGRSPSCEIPLPNDGTVSRRHARLFQREGRLYVVDLGSRNGTLLNGTRLEAEAETPLEAGDRVQVGDTILVLESPARVLVSEADAQPRSGAIEEYLPASGEAAELFRCGMTLLGASSEAAALRCGVEEAMRLLKADAAAALLPSEVGFLTAAVAGRKEVELPRPLLLAAVERREGASLGACAAAPLWSGGASFGLLYAERVEARISPRELGMLGMLGRLCGEAVTRARARRPRRAESLLVGTSRPFKRVLDAVRRAATSTPTVTLHGEPGTGKSLLATFLHSRSSRALGPLVVVDCRAPAQQLEEELFGRAASPGSPPGLSALLRADGGTLVLAGVEALSSESAVRLAHAIDRRKAPLPGGGEGASDFRVVATCREPLERMAAQGALEPELAAVLDGISIPVIALRERRGDIQLLFDFFAERASRQLGGRLPQLSAEVRAMLLDYAWPGNVRELRRGAERLAQLCPGGEVLPRHLSAEISGSLGQENEKLSELISRVERDAIAQALRRARGKKIKAAALLGISRPTLDKKIALYRLTVK